MQRAHVLPLLALVAFAPLLLSACTTYRDDLTRGEKAFEQNQHERALAIFRELEPDTDHLRVEERAQYAYLRGMTDYRIGYRADARHWLAIADAIDKQTPGTLPVDWRNRLNDAMTDLNRVVYNEGTSALTSSVTPVDVSRSPKKTEDEP